MALHHVRGHGGQQGRRGGGATTVNLNLCVEGGNLSNNVTIPLLGADKPTGGNNDGLYGNSTWVENDPIMGVLTNALEGRCKRLLLKNHLLASALHKHTKVVVENDDDRGSVGPRGARKWQRRPNDH